MTVFKQTSSPDDMVFNTTYVFLKYNTFTMKCEYYVACCFDLSLYTFRFTQCHVIVMMNYTGLRDNNIITSTEVGGDIGVRK